MTRFNSVLCVCVKEGREREREGEGEEREREIEREIRESPVIATVISMLLGLFRYY